MCVYMFLYPHYSDSPKRNSIPTALSSLSVRVHLTVPVLQRPSGHY